MDERWQEGYDEGHEDGWDAGYDEGFNDGVAQTRREYEKRVESLQTTLERICDLARTQL